MYICIPPLAWWRMFDFASRWSWSVNLVGMGRQSIKQDGKAVWSASRWTPIMHASPWFHFVFCYRDFEIIYTIFSISLQANHRFVFKAEDKFGGRIWFASLWIWRVQMVIIHIFFSLCSTYLLLAFAWIIMFIYVSVLNILYGMQVCNQ